MFFFFSVYNARKIHAYAKISKNIRPVAPSMSSLSSSNTGLYFFYVYDHNLCIYMLWNQRVKILQIFKLFLRHIFWDLSKNAFLLEVFYKYFVCSASYLKNINFISKKSRQQSCTIFCCVIIFTEINNCCMKAYLALICSSNCELA